MIPLSAALGIAAMAPQGVIPVGAAMFSGAFTAARLQIRRQVLAHFVFGAVILIAPALLLGGDRATLLGLASILPATWTLGFCVVLILEAAEAQGDELERLVRRDPLTGIGNRRMLAESLGSEIDVHRRSGRSLAVVALDLNGFKRLNDELGHEAGDVLLCDVASAIGGTLRPGDVVARQGGDEFCVVLPNTTRAQAETYRGRLREALGRLPDQLVPITSGMGIATYPADGATELELLAIADDRLSHDKPTSRAVGDVGERRPVDAGAAADALTPRPVLVTTPAVKDPAMGFMPTATARTAARFTRVSRAEIAVNRAVWLATGGMIALYTLSAIVLVVLSPDARGLPAIAVCLGMGAITLLTLGSEPPPTRSWLNHLVIAIPYTGSVAFAFAMPAYTSVVLGALAFSGALAAVRLVSRRDIAVHLSSATLLTGALVAFGHTSLPVALALIVMVAQIWGTAFGSVTYIEVAETQGDELERLVRRDPLTGVGNRRLLDEQLGHELRRHARLHRALSVVVLDLNGFKALNDDIGHGAGDDLLREVAGALGRLARPDDTVVRQGGDEFCLVLPGTSADEAAPLANAVRVAIQALGSRSTRSAPASASRATPSMPRPPTSCCMWPIAACGTTNSAPPRRAPAANATTRRVARRCSATSSP